jgi:hypothetical protein
MFSILHLHGSSDKDPPLDALNDLYDELQFADIEHVDVTVIHDDTGWSMSAYPSGRLIFGNLADMNDCHMIPVSRERVLELWRLLAAGDIDTLLKEPWLPGYG